MKYTGQIDKQIRQRSFVSPDFEVEKYTLLSALMPDDGSSELGVNGFISLEPRSVSSLHLPFVRKRGFATDKIMLCHIRTERGKHKGQWRTINKKMWLKPDGKIIVEESKSMQTFVPIKE